MTEFKSGFEIMVENNMAYTFEKYRGGWYVKDVNLGCLVGAPFKTKKAAKIFMDRLENITRG